MLTFQGANSLKTTTRPPASISFLLSTALKTISLAGNHALAV